MLNLREVCKAGHTRAEFPLDLLESIQREFQKGLDGGFFSPSYVLEKLDLLTRHTKWLEQKANEQFRAECADEEDES